MERILGILGGMSWVATEIYYREINASITRLKGRQHSADLLIASPNFQPIIDAQVRNDWAEIGQILSKSALGLKAAGATGFLIASNTIHLVYDQVFSSCGLPGLNILDVTATKIISTLGLAADSIGPIGLLGTRYTMNSAFFEKAYEKHGLNLIKPTQSDAVRVNEIIFKELIHGIIRPESAQFFCDVILRLEQKGAVGVILGCTEISALMASVSASESKLNIPLFDTTSIHIKSAVEWLISGETLNKSGI